MIELFTTEILHTKEDNGAGTALVGGAWELLPPTFASQRFFWPLSSNLLYVAPTVYTKEDNVNNNDNDDYDDNDYYV